MCGICGAIWWDDAGRVGDAALARMTDALAHRGPDERTFWRDDQRTDAEGRLYGVALGFRRLSIIDVDGSHQPLSNESGDVRVVFNGEIYNYRSLRKRIEGRGHRLATDGDGETIVHGYEDDGDDVADRLNGMFAFAVFDGRRHRLLLVRDRIGQKPLYYHADRDRLVFASELKSLATLPGVIGEIDPGAVDEFLTYQYIPPPGTIWRNVRKLPPGHSLSIDTATRRPAVRRYWQFDPAAERPTTREEATERVRELLSDSVRLRMRSDVPLGTFLSGGIDSSIITALAARHAAAGGGGPVRTFSIGFPVADFDETGYAAEVAEHLGTRHRRLEVDVDAIEVLDDLVHHYDEPFGDSSAVPTQALSRLTRSEVTVALSGDGGDELFAGYERYMALHLSQRLSRWLPVHRVPGVSLLQRLPDSGRRYSVLRRAKRFLEALGQSPPRRYMNWIQIFPESLRAELYRDDFVERLPDSDPFEFLERVWERSRGRDLVTRASLSDVESYLPFDLCTKVDIASMWHSLEVRQPMLDHRLVEYAASLPVDLKFDGRRGKLLLRDAFGDLIPDRIFTRKKMGFGIPIGHWFRGGFRPVVDELLLGDDARLASMFRREVIARLVDDHVSGRNNQGYRLWNLLVLEKWMRRWT